MNKKDYKKSAVAKMGEFQFADTVETAIASIRSAVRVLLVIAGPVGKSFIKKFYNGLDNLDNVKMGYSFCFDIENNKAFFIDH